MGIVVDIILIICLIGFIIAGYKKGLTGSLLKLVSFIVAIVLAMLLYKPLAAAIISKTNIDDNIKASIINTFSEEQNTKQTTESDVGLQNIIINNINQDIEKATTDTKNTIVEQSASKISTTIINIGSGIVIFLIAKIILLIISICVKGITQLPIIKQVDKVGGVIYGALEGLLIVYIMLGIISFATVLWPQNSVNKAVTESAICSTLYNNNIILNFFFK